MTTPIFKIDLMEIHWLEGDDDPDDRCAHGKIRVTIANETFADKPGDWWSLSATALHLLRTLDWDHTKTEPVGDCLVPCEGHHIDHLEDSPYVYIETVYPIEPGCNWWVTHVGDNVLLETETGASVTVPFTDYKPQVLSFVDTVEEFYETSRPKNLPTGEYDMTAYFKFWKEWRERRGKWG